jgi:hypothetical protein
MAIHVGDIGTLIVMTCMDGDDVLDISSSNPRVIRLAAPDGTGASHFASFTTDGTDGKIQYATVADDIDQAGEWMTQAWLFLTSGLIHSEARRLCVEDNL